MKAFIRIGFDDNEDMATELQVTGPDGAVHTLNAETGSVIIDLDKDASLSVKNVGAAGVAANG